MNHLWKYSGFQDEALLEAEDSLETDFTEYLYQSIEVRFGLKSTPQHKSLVPLCLTAVLGMAEAWFPPSALGKVGAVLSSSGSFAG